MYLLLKLRVAIEIGVFSFVTYYLDTGTQHAAATLTPRGACLTLSFQKKTNCPDSPVGILKGTSSTVG